MIHRDYDQNSSSSMHGRVSSVHLTKKCSVFRSFLPRKRPELTFQRRFDPERPLRGTKHPRSSSRLIKLLRSIVDVRWTGGFKPFVNSCTLACYACLAKNVSAEKSFLPLRRFWICSAFCFTSFKSWLREGQATILTKDIKRRHTRIPRSVQYQSLFCVA